MEHKHPWHRGSVHGTGRRRPLDRNARARFAWALRAYARAGRITPRWEWVGRSLLTCLGTDGRCDPSHAYLARHAACDERTVRRALAGLRTLGLVTWDCRIVRVGWRCAQTSNAYQLRPEAAGAVPVPEPLKVKKGLGSTATESAAMESRLTAALSALERRLVEEWARDDRV